jgi:predicted ATPase
VVEVAGGPADTAEDVPAGSSARPSNVNAVRNADVPDGLQRLMLGRLDMLPEAPRNALKIASVIGRHFETPSVHGSRPDLGTLDEIDARLALGARADLVVADRVEDRSWLFRHVVTRDVAYDSLPFAMRARLHDSVGRFVESGGEAAIERNLDLLAHHYMRGESDAKKREFTVRAGVAAQTRYANDAAAEHFRNALPLLTEAEQPAIMRRRWARCSSSEAAGPNQRVSTVRQPP